MSRQHEAVGVRDQRVAGDAGGGLVGLREAAVDGEHAAAALHRILAVLHLHRHVPAHDARRLGVHAEVLEDAGHHALVVQVGVERVLDLLARLLLGDQVQLERGHLALGEQGRSLA